MAYHKCASIYGTNNSAASVQTASGAIANFNTKLAMPLKSLKVDFEAIQEAGTPTPESPKAISGVSEVNVFNSKKNLLKYDNASLIYISENAQRNGVIFDKTGTYTWSIKSTELANATLYAKVYSNGSYGNYVVLDQNNPTRTFTLLSNEKLLLYSGSSDNLETTKTLLSKTMFEVGSSPTDFEPYNGNTYNILFPPYSENLPYFEGLLAGTHAFVDLGTLNWNYNSNYVRFIAQLPLLAPSGEVAREHCLCNKYVSNKLAYSDSDRTDKIICISTGTNTYVYVRDSAYSDKDAFKTAMSGIYLIYELAEAVTPTITPEQLQTLLRAFAGVYHGGHLTQDKNGKRKIVATKDKVVLSGGETWTYNSSGFFYTVLSLTNLPNYETIICSNGIKGILYLNNILRVYIADNSDYIDSSTDMRTIMTSATEFTRTYETPIEIPLPDGTPIKSLPGVNNIYADTGDTEVAFKKLI